MSSSGCFRSRRATLDFEGNLIICCEDYNAEYRYGNVFDDGFLNVWKTSLNHRREIFLGNYREYICQVCSGFEPDESLPRRHIVSSIRHLNR